MTLFRANDIRGIYPTEVNEELAENVGKAFGTFILGDKNKAKIAIGGDVRLSTPTLKEKFIMGLLSTGADVIDFGMTPTPVLFYGAVSHNTEGGVVITASHNPGEYNGFKLVGKNGLCLSWDKGIKIIQELVENKKFRVGNGNLEKMDINQAFVEHVTSKVKIQKKLKVVVDASNGACGVLGPKVFEKIGCEVVPLFCELDGTFPNHEADPIKKKNLVHLQEKVRETNADIGVCYDGDGDRIGVVNEKGGVVENNIIFSLLIKDILLKEKSNIVYEVLVSKNVEDTIKKYGGTPILERVGHSLMQSGVRKSGASLGGENSGHYYFKENYGYDDSLFAGLKIAELLNKGVLSEREKEINSYITSEEFRVFCDDNRKFDAINQLKDRLSGYNIIDIDGVRCVFDDGWFIIRASNTGPQLVVRWEAKNNEEFNRIFDIVKDSLKSVDIEFDG